MKVNYRDIVTSLDHPRT